MKKKDLIAEVASAARISRKEAETVVNLTFDTIIEKLRQGERVQISGFGAFEVRGRAARTGRNLKTGESVDIGESRVPAFKAGKTLKDAVSEG
ncbi:MAG: HU family DNA-binding protein [Lachnospiraceae bacterium]|nr:HU family DNA-binding protein [Lachnospiraceae bacterium]